MAQPRHPVPSYRRHKQSGQAVVTLRGLDGKRRDVLLGPWNSLESRQEYARLISEIKAAPAAAISAASTPSDATIDEILVPYLKHADQYYRHPDGTQTGQAEQIRSAIRPLARLYGDTIAREFGPLALAAVRDRMIEEKLSRKVINQRIGVIRQAFRWAVSQQLVPPSTLEGLRSLPALRAGRSKAKERPPVRPADETIIAAALPHLPPTIRALVEVQIRCGARGGELLRMRPGDIDQSGPVWIFKPHSHKAAWHGKTRQVYLGPQAQAALAPLLEGLKADEFVFSPRRSEAERNESRTSKRRTPRYPSHLKRNAAKRKKARLRGPAPHYSKASYGRAIARACEKAFPMPKGMTEAEARDWKAEHHFSPHQLRHLAATRIRKEHGIELSRILLGHSDIGTTQIYAEHDAAKAMDAASKIG
jgi:integrase